MQIANPLKMNDWEIKRFIGVVLTIQIILWGLIGLEAIGLQIPFIRQVVGFIYLTFLPGIVILRILKLHKISSIETLVFSVGLSISFLMFTGFLMNMIYPILGISNPISFLPLIITISFLVLVLCLFSLRDKDISVPNFIDTKNLMSPNVLFLCLIPFLAIFGTFLMNFYQNNILLMILIVIIATIPVFIAFDKIPKNLYPLAIFVIVISLLYHRSLISMYLWGWDINIEYYFSNLVIINSFWNLTIPSNYNAMLSVTMLPPIFYSISNIDLIWTYKIVYPFLFSLVPLGLYCVFQKQTSAKIAFLSVFFLASIFTFYGDLPQLAKQMVAELFFVLLILLMIKKDMNKMKSSLLFLIFGISLVVSHYGSSYIFMLCIIIVWMILALSENARIQGFKNKFYSIFGKKSDKIPKYQFKIDRTISATFVLLFIVFMLTWYMQFSSSSPFNTIVRIGDQIAGSISTEFLNPVAVEGLRFIQEGRPSLLRNITKFLHLVTQLFILIGFVTLLLKYKKMKFEKEYAAFSILAILICVASILVPYFSSSLATTRLYHISLLILAPFFVLGGITFIKALKDIIRSPWTKKNVKDSLKMLSVFLAIFLLFNSGFVYQLFGDNCESISLNITVDYPLFNQEEFSGAKWLDSVKSSDLVYADDYRLLLIANLEEKVGAFPPNAEVPKDSYVYLGTLNIAKSEVIVSNRKGARLIMRKYINSTKITYHRNKVYDNAGSQVYY